MKNWNGIGWIEPPNTIAHLHISTPHPPKTQTTTQLTVTQVLDFVVENGFNALRVPFSLAMALDLGKVNEQWLVDEGAWVKRVCLEIDSGGNPCTMPRWERNKYI